MRRFLTHITNMFIKVNRGRCYDRRHHLRGDRLESVVNLHVVNEVEYLPTPFVDRFIPTRQDCAPLHEIRDYHCWIEYTDGSCAGA